MPSPQTNNLRLFQLYCHIWTKFATHSTYKRNVYFQKLKHHRKEMKYSPLASNHPSHIRVLPEPFPSRECWSSPKSTIYTYLEIKKLMHISEHMIYGDIQKVKRKVEGMPQSQTAANPRHQKEEKKDKTIHAQNKQTNVREAQIPAPASPSEVIRTLKQTEKRGQRAREDFKTLSAPW